MEVSRRFLCIHLTLQVNGSDTTAPLIMSVCLLLRWKILLKATHQWGALCEGGNTGRNGRGALLISRLLRFSYVKLSWMCLGSEIDVSKSLGMDEKGGIQGAEFDIATGWLPYTGIHWPCLSWSSAPLFLVELWGFFTEKKWGKKCSFFYTEIWNYLCEVGDVKRCGKLGILYHVLVN